MGLLYHIHVKRKRTAAGSSCPLRALSHIGEGESFGYHADLAAQGLEQLIFLVPFAEGVRLERVQHSGASVADSPMGVPVDWLSSQAPAGQSSTVSR